jgi:hypothetical protein
MRSYPTGGFTHSERFLIFVAPILAAVLTLNYQWRKDAHERAAEMDRRAQNLESNLAQLENTAREVKSLGVDLRALREKLDILESARVDGHLRRDPFEPGDHGDVPDRYPPPPSRNDLRPLGDFPRAGFRPLGDFPLTGR